MALIPALAMRGFTVDDALIPARYAFHLATGRGYRFNATGPITDGVTPLGWAHLLAPFAREGPLAALAAAKAIGGVAWTASAALLAIAIDRVSGQRARFAALALIACSAPLAAWSVAGLETGLVIGLAAAAVALRELSWANAGAACAGFAAGLRPELLPWALVVAAAPGPERTGALAAPHRDIAEAERGATAGAIEIDARPSSGGRRLWVPLCTRGLLGIAPFAVAAAVRTAVFGRPSPLSVIAKAPDAALGARYALACFLLAGPVAIVAPIAWRRAGPWPRALVGATFAHVVAIALAGGDWMPLSRLTAPVLPTVALAAAHLASIAGRAATAIRFALAIAAEVWVFARIGPKAARVSADRAALVEELRRPLRGARAIATVDVGWAGAAASGVVVDLAGVTDPAVAALPGGHTTKAIPPALLDARGVDTLLLLLDGGAELAVPWTASRFARGVEQRLARAPGMAEQFEPVLVSTPEALRYVVLRRRAGTTEAAAAAEAP